MISSLNNIHTIEKPHKSMLCIGACHWESTWRRNKTICPWKVPWCKNGTCVVDWKAIFQSKACKHYDHCLGTSGWPWKLQRTGTTIFVETGLQGSRRVRFMEYFTNSHIVSLFGSHGFHKSISNIRIESETVALPTWSEPSQTPRTVLWFFWWSISTPDRKYWLSGEGDLDSQTCHVDDKCPIVSILHKATHAIKVRALKLTSTHLTVS